MITQLKSDDDSTQINNLIHDPTSGSTGWLMMMTLVLNFI